MNARATMDADLEVERRRNHHEVLCLVLGKLVDAYLSRPMTAGEMKTAAPIHRELAVLYADLAYPPPKQEPSE